LEIVPDPLFLSEIVPDTIILPTSLSSFSTPLMSEIVPDTIIFEAPALQAALALPAKRGGFPVFSASHNADHSRSLPP
jgi:hypothetical protein